MTLQAIDAMRADVEAHGRQFVVGTPVRLLD
jgi:hypothetical protein